jgi:hypothetical protein
MMESTIRFISGSRRPTSSPTNVPHVHMRVAADLKK